MNTQVKYSNVNLEVLFRFMLDRVELALRAEPLLSLSCIHGKNRLCTNLVHPLKSP